LGTGGSPASGGAAGAAGALNVGGSGVSGNGTCTVEDCGKSCTIPTLPESSALSANAKLPDPFKMMSGTRIAAKSEWECRRAEISAQVQKYEMGVKTPKPVGAVTGSLSGSNLTVTVGGKTFSVGISAPSNGKAPYPAIIALDGGSLPTDAIKALGVAVINLSTTTMGDQTGTGSRGKGFFFDVNGADDGAGALIAWAWGTSRVIDALEATPAAKINPKRIAVTGCSRNGKGALAMGAFDERVALTIPQESGSGGTAAWRVSDAEDGGANKVQTLHEIVGENCWFKSSLSQFSNSASKLPYDHHSLLGMVAPRGLLIIENTDYQWLGVNSCITAATAAQMIYQGLGAPDNIGFTNSGHTHCGFNSAELPYLQAYIKKFLLDQSVDTKVWNVSKAAYGGGGAVDKAKWIDWTAPTLN
jgi:hypothetical protein